jgi:hypothetical protein
MKIDIEIVLEFLWRAPLELGSVVDQAFGHLRPA